MCNVEKKLIYINSLSSLYLELIKYSRTSLIRSPTGLGKSDLNGEVTLLQGQTSYSLHCGIQFGTDQGDRNGEVTLLVR